MSYNTDTLVENFVEFIQDKITGLVIVAEQTDAPRPSKSSYPLGFSAVKIISIDPQGMPEYEEVNSSGEQNVTRQDKLEIDIQTFGPNAKGRLNSLLLEFLKKSTKTDLKAICLSYLTSSTVLDISTTLDTDWEERAQVSISFYAKAVIIDGGAGCIENTEITENFTDNDGNITRSVVTTINTP